MSGQPPSGSGSLVPDSGPPSGGMSVPSQGPTGGPSGGPGIPGAPPQNLNTIVIEYLSKKGYSRTEAMLRMESSSANREGRTMQQKAEEAGGPKYTKAFILMRDWVEHNLDIYKPEYQRILWPLFVYSFLGLIADTYPRDAEKYFNTFKEEFLPEHEDDLRRLAALRLPDHIAESQVGQHFRGSKYRISLTNMAYLNLIQFLESREKEGAATIVNILQNSCKIVMVARSTSDLSGLAAMLQRALDARDTPSEDEGIPGHNPGSANTSENAPAVLPKLKLGMLPMEPELMTDVLSELEEEDAKTPPREGKTSLVEHFEKYIKQEPNDDAPSRSDVPLPPSLARDVAMEVQKVKENRDRFKIEGVRGGVAPAVSIVMYSFHNSYDGINCLDFSDDNIMVAAGTDDSYIRVWSLDGRALPSLMPRNPDDTSPESSRRLIGHSGPVYMVAFSPAIHIENPEPNSMPTSPRYLLSSSADKSVRMWSIDTWTCLVVYKGHDDPVWDVTWGPFGHYFVTGARDKTARLWSTDHISYLRMFVGHERDVDITCFHPNSAYIFTGSSDRTVRMWSISTGNAVRLFTGHTGNLTALACSPDGKTLASADDAGSIFLWDLASGRRLKRMRGHGRGGIWSISWSVESTVLVSGGADATVRVWDVAVPNEAQAVPQQTKAIGNVEAVAALTNKLDGGTVPPGPQARSGVAPGTTPAGVGVPGASAKKKSKEVVVTPDQLSVFMTKKTPVYKVKFTRMNLIIAGGAFLP